MGAGVGLGMDVVAVGAGVGLGMDVVAVGASLLVGAGVGVELEQANSADTVTRIAQCSSFDMVASFTGKTCQTW